jgi:hypothetical protein
VGVDERERDRRSMRECGRERKRRRMCECGREREEYACVSVGGRERKRERGKERICSHLCI